jgi:hypothetical protein
VSRIATLAFVAALGVALGTSVPARAAGPVQFEVGAKVGAGGNPIGGGFPSSLGFGAGGRAGLSISGLYGGLSAMYYVGDSGRILAKDGTAIESGSVSPRSFLYGVELGYSWWRVRVLELRASLGVGDYLLGMGGGVSVGSNIDNFLSPTRPVDPTNYLYLEPALTVLATMTSFYAGFDVSALLLPSGPRWPPVGPGFSSPPFSSSRAFDVATTAHAQVGVKF